MNKEGKCAIIIKITVDGEYERLNFTLSIEPGLWDASASKAIGRSSKIAEFNKRIEDMRHVLKEHYYDLLNRHGYVTAEMVKNAFTGVTAYANEYSLFNFMESIIVKLKQNGKVRTSETYKSALNSFKKFRQEEDIMLDCLTSEIMEAYEAWHKSRGVAPNTISFYTRILRAVYNRARSRMTSLRTAIRFAMSIPALTRQ